MTISQADIRLSKNGAAFAQTNNVTGATHMENGYYSVPLDTTDTNTLGRLTVAVSESGALAVWKEFEVLTANVFDSLFSTDNLQVDVTQIGGDTQSATDLKDFADAGYDPATNKVQGVVLVDTTTTNTDMRGTDSAFLAASAPTNFSSLGINASGHVSRVVLVDTTTTNTDMRGTDSALLAASAPTNFGDLAITATTGLVTVGTNNDKTGYSLVSTGLDLVTAWTVNITGNITGNLTGTIGSLATQAKADVNAEVDTALADINLDHLVKSAVDTNFATTVHLDSVLGQLADTGTTASFDRTTDSVEAIRNRGDSAWITATSVTVSDKTGFSLASTGLDLVTAWTVNITGSVTSVTGAVGSVTGNVGGSVASVATGGITAASFAAGAINAAALAADAGNEIADAVLGRAVENVAASSDKHSLAAVVMISTNSSISGSTLSAKNPNGDSTVHTYTITASSVDPITGIS